MGDAGIAIIALGVLYFMSKKNGGLVKNGNGNGGTYNYYQYTGPGNGSPTVEEQDPHVEQAPIVKPRLSLTTWKKTPYVSKATGEISPGTYTRPKHIPPAIAKRGDILLR